MSGPSTAALSEQAYVQIREKVMRGEYPIGSALSRRKLATEFHMSFLPISEALQRLETEGLVESKPRVGTRVRIPTVTAIREQYVIREALEAQAARLFSERATAAQRAEIKRMARHLDELYACAAEESADVPFLISVHTGHTRFHLRIVECVRCAALQKALEDDLMVIFNVYDTAVRRRNLPARYHSELADAVAGNDPLAADAAMRFHVHFGLDKVIEAIKPRLKEKGWRMPSVRAAV